MNKTTKDILATYKDSARNLYCNICDVALYTDPNWEPKEYVEECQDCFEYMLEELAGARK